MSTSGRSLTEEYRKRTNIVRSDLVTVDQFAKESCSEDDCRKLFWHVWRPLSIPLGSQNQMDYRNMPPLPDDLEDALLNKLRDFVLAARVPYQPDATDEPDIFSSGLKFVHVCGAWTLRLKLRDGYSDDVRLGLTDTWRMLCRLGIPGSEDVRRGWIVDTPISIRSVMAVSGLIQSEMFSVKCLDGAYEEALHSAAMALNDFAVVKASLEVTEEELSAGGVTDTEAELEQRKAWRQQLQDYHPLLNMDAQKVVDTFEALCKRNKSAAWQQVGQDCLTMAQLWEFCGGNSEEAIRDSQQREWGWRDYWHRAEGWVEARLPPNQVREYLNDKEDRNAESRLVRYFFGKLWDGLPSRARDHLIKADVCWFLLDCMAMQGMLNDLQVAVESTCFDYLWEPLRQMQGGAGFLEFAAKQKQLQQRGRNPTLRDYAWLCHQRFFEDFLLSHHIERQDKDFLTRELPKAMNDLRRVRDLAQHDPKKVWQREEVEPFVGRFLGIGQIGVLPRLAQIGEKLLPRIGRRI